VTAGPGYGRWMAAAVVIPGRAFGPYSPLLMYTGDVAEELGADVHRHEWTAEPPGKPELYQPVAEAWVGEQVSPLVDRAGGRPLLIGKSLGTNAAALAAGRDLPAVWLTPLLGCAHVVAALRRATAPFLLIGGTADRQWDSAVAHGLTPHVFEVADADHGMYVPAGLSASIAVLARVADAAAEFLDEIGWPAHA
jgi:hypothetical protein